MQITVAYADADHQLWLPLDVPDNCTAQEAIESSGILKRIPSIELKRQKIGVFGKFVKPDTPLQAGDRVEIYRPITIVLDDDDDDD